jgi:hypothetical protein
MVDPLRTQDGRVRRRANLTLHNKRVLPIGHSDVRTRSERTHVGGFLGDDIVDNFAVVVHIRVLLDIQVAEHDTDNLKNMLVFVNLTVRPEEPKKKKGVVYLFLFVFCFFFRRLKDVF